MIFNNFTAIAFLFILFSMNLLNYFMIRSIIWSIAWCDKGGKYNSMKKIKQSQTTVSKANMFYLLQYTNAHRKEFIFWIKVKLYFIIIESMFVIAYVACGVFENTIYCDAFRTIAVVQSIVCFFILVFQSDMNRQTKYDRCRRNKHH